VWCTSRVKIKELRISKYKQKVFFVVVESQLTFIHFTIPFVTNI